MDRFYLVTNTVRAQVAGLAEWLFGCGHRRTSFPMTPRARAGAYGEPGVQSNTYIVCLECGRHFAYDWSAMHIAKRRIAGIASPAFLPAQEEERSQ
jgi:hypothetical protein